MGRAPSPAQLYALRFLAKNGGLEVPHMNMAGRSKEWPTRRTLQTLVNRDWAIFTIEQYSWRIDISDAGRTIIAR